MKAKFYICEHCGNLVTTIHNAGVPLVCCGEKMKELLPNTVEASGEKHLPVAELSGSTLIVTVGAVEHPMVDVHHIQWLFVETEAAAAASSPLRWWSCWCSSAWEAEGHSHSTRLSYVIQSQKI